MKFPLLALSTSCVVPRRADEFLRMLAQLQKLIGKADAGYIRPDGTKGTLKINTNRRLDYCENITMSFCVLIKGPCRGKQCDFWARIKIRKRSVEELVRNLNDSITECKDNTGFDLKNTLDQFWYEIGVRNMEKLCHEEPDLCAKIKEVEGRIKS